MKEFVKDYKDLCKVTGQFYKKHWKGLLLVNGVIVGAELLWFKKQNKDFQKYLEEIEDSE